VSKQSPQIGQPLITPTRYRPRLRGARLHRQRRSCVGAAIALLGDAQCVDSVWSETPNSFLSGDYEFSQSRRVERGVVQLFWNRSILLECLTAFQKKGVLLLVPSFPATCRQWILLAPKTLVLFLLPPDL